MTKVFLFKVHRAVNCPNCKVGLDYSKDIVNKRDIRCPNCGRVFSYNDGFIELLSDTKIDVFLARPIYSSLLESGSFNVRVGKATRVRFQNPFYEIYDVAFGTVIGETNEELFEQIKLKATDISNEEFVVLSSSFDDSIVNENIKVCYFAMGEIIWRMSQYGTGFFKE